MMITLRAHFDGKVIVPDEPVDLPRGAQLEVQVRSIEKASNEKKELPTFAVKPGARPITVADVRRAMEDET